MIVPTIVRSRMGLAAFVVFTVASLCEIAGQEFEVGIIDFYGLNRISESHARGALTFTEGSTLVRSDRRPAALVESEARLATLPGVTRARINVVCCEQSRVIVYVGLEQRGSSAMSFRATPAGPARLEADIVRSGDEFLVASMRAIERGDAAEDHAQGHALMHDPSARAIQERFVLYAKRDLDQLRLVLRSSGDAAHRALAALVLGYAPDKQAVVEDLVHAIGDPDGEVRNNAMRALLVFADMDPGVSRAVPRIPSEPFIALLNSPVWSDRNKASGALMILTARRDAAILARVREGSLAALVEMARWKSAHAFAAFTILGRISGYSDGAAQALWDAGDREIVIEAASRQQ